MNSPEEKNLSFLIADLAGYTAFTEAHGDRAAANIINQFIDIIHNSLYGSAQLLERVGDEVLIIGEDPDDLLKTAIKIASLAEEKHHFPALHIGLHKGNIFEKDGYYYGSTLNLTSRIADYSREGQILCSAEFIQALTPDTNHHFKNLGALRFKNYSRAVEIYEIHNASASAFKETDPVCKMLLIAEQAPAKLPYKEKTYFFCSLECARAFATEPHSYIFTEKTQITDHFLE